VVVGPFALKGSQNCNYRLMLMRSLVFIQDATAEIGGAPVKFISRMGQRACRLPFYIYSQPITALWIDATMEPSDCRKD
jgi:hypothetical protein